MAEIRLEHIIKTFERGWTPFPRIEGVEVEQTGTPEPVEEERTAGVVRSNAVDDVSLLIKDGETMSIIGPSGCGKTTLLRVIAGLENPTGGRVFYDGVDVTEVAVRDRLIGMVFQNYALYPHMTSKSNMRFFFQMHKREPEAEDRVKGVTEIMGPGFRDLLNRNPKTLSGGQKQRVAIARCIIRDPRLFLFDEPLSSLDAKLRSQTRVEIKRLLRRFGITAVYVTHDQTEAIALGDRIAVMRDGKIEQVGTYWEVHDTPANTFVAGFVGMPTMNLLPARVADGKLHVGDTTLKLSPSQIQALANCREITLGIRPQHLGIAEGGFPATVELVEQLPSERAQYIHATLPDGKTLVAKVGMEQQIYGGNQVALAPDMAKVHFFDGADGSRINWQQ